MTLALGVLSVALLTTIGLLPVGLNTARAAMDHVISAQIVQQISGEASRTAFTNLDTYVAKSPLYFDQEGQIASGSSFRRFKVELGKIDATAEIFPGSTKSPSLTNSLYAIRAVISDARVSGGAATNTSESSTHVIYIPNSGG